MKHCFKIGLYKQGILHDLSKYSLREFIPGCIYYQGFQSPNTAERFAKGYSSAWLHHKGRNKHHYEYWIDHRLGPIRGMIGTKMPNNYIAEMIMDRIAASKIYCGEKYDTGQPLAYYELGKTGYIIHLETRALLEFMLHMLKEKGEDYTFAYIRKYVVNKPEYPKIPSRFIKAARKLDPVWRDTHPEEFEEKR